MILITGASAGLGQEYAYQLADLGHSLLLVARREQRLVELQQELLQLYPNLQVRFFVADLAKNDAAEKIVNHITEQNLPLTGLINNAGFGQRGEFAKGELAKQMQMLQVNINALVALTYLCLPMLENNKNSFIVNIASTAAFQAGPNLAIYYASKAFVLSFTEALHEELKSNNIKVSALCPGATKTEFAQVAGMSDSLVFKLRVMDKKPVIQKSLNNLHKAIVIPGLMNKLAVLFVKLIPRAIARKLAFFVQK